MNRDLHDTDDFFKSAYRQFEDEPSPEVWEKINAGLEKKDADSNKRRLIVWRRAAFLLLLFLTGFILFDAGVLKTGSGRSNNNTIIKKSHTPELPVKQNEINNNGIGSADKEAVSHNEKATTLNQNDNAVLGIDSFTGKRPPESKTTIRDIPWLVTDQLAIVTSPAVTEKNSSSYLKEKINAVPLFDNNNAGNLFTGLLYSIEQSPLPPLNTAVIKSTDTKQEMKNSFAPYWLITAFASYDRVNYKLDSDIPNSITSIKHREVHEPSSSGGILLTRQLTPRWGLQSGLIYSNTAIGMKPQKTYAFQDPTGDVAYKYITSSGYAFIKPGFGAQPVVGDSLTTAEAKHTIEHISLPLVFKHPVSNKKISLSPGVGVEANFITKANLEVDIEDPFNREIVVIRKLNGTKSFYWSFVADAELKYNINKKMSVIVRPVYRHAISPITKNNVVETFPHSFGVGAGITIKF